MFIQEFEKTAGMAMNAVKGIGKFIKKNPIKSTAAIAGGVGIMAGKAMGGSKESEQPGGAPMLGQ